MVGPKTKPSWWNEKVACSKLYGERCYVCHRKFGKGFTFHHLYYKEIGREANENTIYTDRDYHERIYAEIRKNPKQFLLVCNKHHYNIEKLKKYTTKKLDRLVKAVRMSNQGG